MQQTKKFLSGNKSDHLKGDSLYVSKDKEEAVTFNHHNLLDSEQSTL